MGVTTAKRRQTRRLQQAAVGACLCLIFYYIFLLSGSARDGVPKHPASSLRSSLFLTAKQCADAFPGLSRSIDDVVAEGPFTVKNKGDLGPLQARIRDGKIYVLNAERRRDLSTEMLNSRTAALHQLHRAIVTSPEPVPDTVFAINFQDQPYGTAWGYSRAANLAHRGAGPDDRSFLMPHFSFWAWKLPFVGSVWRAAAAIDAIERQHADGGLASKTPKAVWRGTPWFNSVHNPRLRQSLLTAARGKAWADVAALDWHGENATNALPVEDFCRFRYVLHTEGVAYSGRFQFLQMCASVVLTPPIQWMQHTTHLVRPVFTADIPDLVRPRPPDRGGEEGEEREKLAAARARGRAKARERARKAWPVSYRPDEANVVFVAPDWSDLEDTIAWLEAHPAVAQGIASRQRDLFVGGGYFSPAAEACYWRALVRGWSKVARFDEEEWRGVDEVAYEAFALSNGE